MKVKFTNTKAGKFLIPETKEEWEALKALLIEKGLEDSPETWTFILSQLQGVKMPELSTTMSELTAHYKRWKIAKLLQDEKAVYLSQLQDKLKQKMEELIKLEKENEGASPSDISSELPVGAQHIPGDMQELSEAKEGMV